MTGPRPPAPGDGVSNEVTEDVRLAVYRHFARSGRAPAVADLASATGAGHETVRHALRRLHESRDVVLGEDRESIVMAHPFASVPLGSSVMGRRTLWWGGCAWDAFALPHLLPDESPVLVATRCPNCLAPHAWSVGTDAPPSGDQVAHFLTPTRRVWEDVVNSCAHQSLFCAEECVREWLAREGLQRGYVMDLATLWRLARGWYAGRLERGYRRLEPSQAASYFAGVGLSGPFWGLPGAPSAESG